MHHCTFQEAKLITFQFQLPHLKCKANPKASVYYHAIRKEFMSLMAPLLELFLWPSNTTWKSHCLKRVRNQTAWKRSGVKHAGKGSGIRHCLKRARVRYCLESACQTLLGKCQKSKWYVKSKGRIPGGLSLRKVVDLNTFLR